MYRFSVGKVDCAVLEDGTIRLVPERIFPPARRSEWPALTLDEQGRFGVSINTLVIWLPGQVVLVDTGAGTKPGGKWTGAGRLPAELALAGVRPEDVDLVLLTHLAEDHVGGATVLDEDQLRLTFPRARYLLPRADWEYYTAPGQIEQAVAVRDSVRPLLEAGRLELVAGEVAAAPGVRMLPAPGHSPGHSVVEIVSEGQTAIHLADLAHHRLQLEKPDLVRDLDALPEQVVSSRRRLCRQAIESSALVVVAHEPHPGLGRLVDESGRIVLRPIG